MKIKSDYVLRCISNDYVVVPIAEEADRIQGLISLSETGAFLWKLLAEDKTEDELVAALLDEYNVDEATARKGVKAFIKSITEIGCLD